MVSNTQESVRGSERRIQILDIAAKLFAAKGYTVTTVRDIADEAGILSGSLYHHFASKEVILSEILHEFLDRLVSDSEAIVAAGGAPDHIFDQLVRDSFRVIEQHRDAVALYQNESALLTGQPGFEFVSEQSQRITQTWVHQLEEGQRAGVFRESLNVTTAYRFLRDALWSTVHWYRPGRGLNADSLSEQFLALFRRGLLAD
jgi:AcrR family transcriptional regulator